MQIGVRIVFKMHDFIRSCKALRVKMLRFSLGNESTTRICAAIPRRHKQILITSAGAAARPLAARGNCYLHVMRLSASGPAAAVGRLYDIFL